MKTASRSRSEVPTGALGDDSLLLLRDVRKRDLPDLKRLAAVLNTMNLPHNEETLRRLISHSERSFAGKVKLPFEREYLFVLEDPKRQKLIGTSMVIAQHGTFEAPHIYYDVTQREHYSATLDRHFRHKVLSIGYNYDGPTEIGGLVVGPSERSGPAKPGKQLSYVRFLFMAMHRTLFRDQVLAELMPPLMKDGRSLLWEAVGKKLTGLSYEEADRLSRKNKEFIKELFLPSDIYASLFPRRTRDIIGQVGPQTRGVQRMLERIGFHYAERVDPFDGGPHFEAKLEDISLVQRFALLTLSPKPLDVTATEAGEDVLVGWREEKSSRGFHAIRTRIVKDAKQVRMSRAAQTLLGARPGAALGVIPFE
jgi:arginine N-succinyltransferase